MSEITFKERILSEAIKQLLRLGPSSMTMDMVARGCGMSKRTLYETFPTKKELVKECLATLHEQRTREHQQIFAQSQNCFEAFFKIYVMVRTLMQGTTINFTDEIKRLYPDIYAERRIHERGFIQGLSKTLLRAQHEGLVLESINTSIAAFIFVSEMDHVNRSEQIAELGFSRIEVFDATFVSLLRGIATVKGLSMIDEFLTKQNSTTTI